MAVIVYSTPVCPYCTMAKEFLKRHSIKFTEYNIMEDREKAKEMIKKSGQNGVPVIDVNGTIVIGFNEAKLRQLLKIK